MWPVVTGTVSLPEYVAVLAALAVGYVSHRLAHRAAAVLTDNRRLVALMPLALALPALGILAGALTYPAVELGSLLILLAWTAVTVPTWADWRVAVPQLRALGRTESESDRLQPAITYTLLAYTLVLAAILRLFRLGAEAYYIDETITLTFARRWPTVELLWVIPFRQPHVPLYYVLIDGWTAAFGTAEAVTRLPSVLFSVAMVGAVFVLGRRLYTDRVGLLAAFLTAISPFQVLYAQWTRMYALLGLLAVIGALAAFDLLDTDKDGRLGRYLLASGLLAATHVYGLFTLGAHWAYFAWRWPSADADTRRRIRRAVLGSGLLAGPWVVALGLKTVAPGWYGQQSVYVSSIDAAFPWFPSDPHHLAPAIQWLFAGYQSGAVAWATTAVVLLALGWAVAGRRRPSPSGGLLLTWLLVPLAVALAISTAHPIFKFKHGMVVAPALYLLMAVGLARQRRLVIGAVLAVLVVTSGLALADQYTTDRYRPYDDAVGYIETHGEPDDLVLVTGVENTPMAFYSREAGLRYVSMHPGYDRDLSAVIDGEDCLWLIYDWPGAKYGPTIDTELRTDYRVIRQQRFSREKQGFKAGVVVRRYEHDGGCYA